MNPMNPKNPELIRAQILDLVRQYHTAKFTPKTFDPNKDLVHYSGRVFDAEEIVNLVDASLDFYLTANRYAERFEAEFADYLGLSNALLVNSGSSANLVALTVLTSPKLKDRRLKPGDEVLTVACGFPTTLNPTIC
jgi:CDP-6-deoxy-D-xylo-4-hexulose-3-dehydrase